MPAPPLSHSRPGIQLSEPVSCGYPERWHTRTRHTNSTVVPIRHETQPTDDATNDTSLIHNDYQPAGSRNSGDQGVNRSGPNPDDISKVWMR